MASRLLTLRCDVAIRDLLCRAIREYAHAAYPEGGSDCAQVARYTLLEAASAIDAAIELQEQRGNAEPLAIEVATYRAALEVCDRPAPANEYAAKFSLQHCVALALSDGRVGFESFDEAARRRLAALSRRVTLRAAEPFVSAYPGNWGARVTLKLDGGQELVATRAACKGDPDQPLGDAGMVAKAELLFAHGGIDGARAKRIIGTLLGLAGDRTGGTLASILESEIRPSLK